MSSTKHILNAFFLLIAFCLPIVLSAQKAEKTYERLGYKKAIELYKGGNKKEEAFNRSQLVHIANGYRLNGDYENAETWYAQIVENSSQPIYNLYYAQALQANGKCEKAIEHYEAYDAAMNEDAESLEEGKRDMRGRNLADACRRIENFKESEGVKVKNVKALNTKKLDFSPMYYEDGLIFVSTRDTDKRTERVDLWINDNFMDLYMAPMNDNGSFGKIKPFTDIVNTKYHEGPSTFNAGGDVMYFTRNNFIKGKARKDNDGTILLKIYEANKVKDKWTNVRELAFNDDEITSAHPTLGDGGTKMYFASDKKGGYGGMDLYVSELKGGKWSKPQNLGPKVNTAGNELFPFMHDDGTLYFSSNGLPGLGGLDIYSANLTRMGDTMVWANVENLGKPFNSKKDDFGFIADLTKTSGYFTSSRPGGVGGDDIYSWEGVPNMKKQAVTLPTTVCVYDKETNERIEGARVSIRERNPATGEINLEDEFIAKMTPIAGTDEFKLTYVRKPQGVGVESDRDAVRTGENGEVRYVLDPDREYVFIAEKIGYTDGEQEFITDGYTMSENLEFCIPLAKETCTALNGTVINKKYSNKLPGATVTILDKCTGDTETLVSDANGEFNFCLQCGCDYELVGEKMNFLDGEGDVTTVNIDCDQALTAQLLLTPGKKPDPVAAAPANPVPPVYNYPPLLFPNPPKIGDKIVLEKLYYDFDKFYIRSDAKDELDKVVQLLNRYPSMEIELSSHTDARGSNRYNERLSNNRAKAAVEYIVSRGINASRLKAVGFGERYPRNECKDGVNCDETKHQYNRRTEIRVIRLDPNVDIEYNDTRPEYIDPKPGKRK